ncbi:ATP-grasp domain-containing protein [bacterium]|nr:ATP-grasp domain-containing protein [bacterium]
MDTILLLGASADQLFAIRTAKAMGLRVLTVDMNPQSPGFAMADDYAVVSTRDVPALIDFLDGYHGNGNNICGVLVMGSDIPQVVSALAEHLGTPGISMESALLSTHKYNMKRRFRECGVPVPWFSLVNSVEDLHSILKERDFPLVIKPVDRSGARGVFRLTENDDLDSLYEESKRISFCGQVMVEEYLPGLQISTETVMYKSKAYTPGFADRNYEMLEIYAPQIIENGGWVPSIVNAAQRAAVESLVERAGLALGVTDGVVKGDVVLTDEGPVMIEMAARLSGGDFSESLIPLGCGVNIVEAAINIAIGREPDFDALKPKWNRGVVNRYFFPKPGRLLHVKGIDEARKKPWLKKLEFWYQPGDIVPQVRSHADRFGVFIVTGDTREESVERAEWVYRTIEIVTEPV